MPCRPVRLALAAAFAAACHGALAQTAAAPPAVTVQQLAPQLVQFAGSPSNFENLINGLAQGTPIQLTSVLPEGFTQIVTFTPTGALSPTQIAQVLESARQQLIGLGIGAPTAEQIGIALMGGRVPTPLGGSQLAGVLPSAAAQAQNATAAVGGTAPSALTNSVNVQLVPNAPVNATGVPRINTSDSALPAGAISRTPILGNVSNSPLPAAATPAPHTPATQPTTSAPAAAPLGATNSGQAR